MTCPSPSQALCISPLYLSRSSSPTASLTSPDSSFGRLNQAIRFWLRPMSQRTMSDSCVCDSLSRLS